VPGGGLGLPYAFASHFAPDLLLPALQMYREYSTVATARRAGAMVGVNVICAESDGERAGSRRPSRCHS
jgi:hypothetical protein